MRPLAAGPALVGILIASAAPAQTEAEAAILPRFIDTVCLDLVEDLAGCETVILMTSETSPDAADLMILADRRSTEGPAVLAVARDIAFNGPFYGQSPVLGTSPQGQLLLSEEQSGVGRSPWFQTLTIRHDPAGFVIGAQSYSTYDRAVGGGYSCDVDFLAGTWRVSADRVNPETEATTYDVSLSGEIAPEPPLFTDWSASRGLPPPCAAALTEWFDAAP